MTASNPPTAIHQLCTLGLVKVFGWMDGFPYDKCFVKLSVMSPWATRCLRADENTFWNGFETTFPKKLILWRMPLTGWLLLSVAGTLESLLKQSNGYAHVRWGTFLGVCVCVCVYVDEVWYNMRFVTQSVRYARARFQRSPCANLGAENCFRAAENTFWKGFKTMFPKISTFEGCPWRND